MKVPRFVTAIPGIALVHLALGLGIFVILESLPNYNYEHNFWVLSGTFLYVILFSPLIQFMDVGGWVPAQNHAIFWLALPCNSLLVATVLYSVWIWVSEIIPRRRELAYRQRMRVAESARRDA